MEFLVFVYGSLKNGFGNHWVLEGQEFICSTTTKDRRYRMVSLDSFPAVLKGGHCAITGELYKVSISTMAYLDMLEGNGELYKREKVMLESGDTAWMYIFLHGMKTPRHNSRVMTKNRTQTWLAPSDGMTEVFKVKSTT